ncbi:MMPL family transporter [Streptomyces sp. NPDC093105]|uniref:MMPL family transporter n=1 Tax=Streptomyces sp. NPDC093105 TaxID=3366029 RepID=UPI00382BCA4C
MIWTSRPEGEQITARKQQAARQIVVRLTGTAGAPVLSQDGRAMSAVIGAEPDGGAARLAAVAKAAASVGGTSVHLAGPAAAQTDLDAAFSHTDGTLLAVALGGVLLILLLVYRSVIMPLLVIVSSLLALAVACAVLCALAQTDWLSIDGQTQGIVFVLVVGASTDYALLLAARAREELAEQPDTRRAMTAACRATAPTVLASAATIACAMTTLVLSDLPSERALGPAVAIAMACCTAVSLTFLSAVLALCGRRVLRPRAGTPGDWWARPARALEHRPRRAWAGCLALLAAGAAMAPLLAPTGVPLHQALPAQAPSVAGHTVLVRHFPAGTASPLIALAPAARSAEVRDRIASTPGVAATAALPAETGGRAQILATLSDSPDSAPARNTVARLRGSLARTGALVGGQSAQLADLHQASVRDHRLIMPLVLVAAAWVSLFTAFGASALLFQLVFGNSVTEPAVVLFSFVFLVGLGIDYNIFLVHRIRAEAIRHGTTVGVRRGLVTTGGVISAAGLILAATFAALTVMPLLYLAQIGCIVALGVLIDILLVRLFLVPP